MALAVVDEIEVSSVNDFDSISVVDAV